MRIARVVTLGLMCLAIASVASAQQKSSGKSGADSNVELSASAKASSTESTAKADSSASALTGATAADADVDASTAREQRFLLHNTWLGPVGGLRVVDAGSGPKGTFRIQLGTDFFFASDYLVDGDQHSHVGGTLSFSWTPFDFMELSLAALAVSNTNDQEDPELFQVVGDMVFGLKGFYSVLPWLTIGGDLSAALLNTVGDVGLVLEATSLGIRGNLSADFRRLNKPIPLIARFGAQYYLDNSSELVADIERARFNALPDPATNIADEDRHLVSRVERFALGINRIDRVNLAIGFEAPLPVAKDFYLSPIAEWQLGIPVNRQNYDCLFVAQVGEDSCLDQEGFSAFPMLATVGLRILPPIRGLAGFAAVDIGLQGSSTFVRELVPTVPYSVLLGLSYAYDTVNASLV